jgi:peptide/nickel transport system substrate-binding protein
MRTRVVATTALIAASAMILAACGSSPGQQTSSSTSAPASSQASSQSSAPAASGSATGSASGSATGSASGTGGASSSAPSSGGSAGTVGGSACGTPHGPYSDPGTAKGSVTAGYNELATSLNNLTSHGNSTYNANPLYFMDLGGLFYYDDKSNLINDDSFGTCTLVSLKPLTIKYTIKDGVQWSDGVPVTAADLLLSWAAQSGLYNTAEAAYDDNGNLLPSKGVAFDSSSPGLATITDFPEISDNGQSLTVTYSSFFVDYNVQLNVGVPAHVVAEHVFKETDATKATADLVTLLKNNLPKSAKDPTTMKALADFWNTGFDMTQMPTDKSLLVSNGPYVLSDWKKDNYMTFTVNPKYNWGPKPSIQTIVWQYAPDPTAAVQSLQNGDIQIINPQATADVATSLKKLSDQGIKMINQDGATYEHVDLVFDNGGPFDPKTYGGGDAGAKKALAVRQAFLQTVPRQDIVNRLIKPLNPNAVLRQSFTLFPGQPAPLSYDQMVKENGSDVYADAGSDAAIAKAKQILSDAGVTASSIKPIRLMYADNNPRRAQEFQLIAASAKKAGLTVQDGKNAKWSSQLPNTKIYDASLFAWQSTSTGVTQNPPNYLCEDTKATPPIQWGQNNFGHYCSKAVNDSMTAIQSESDPAKQYQDLLTTEKALWSDAFGTLLFQFPDIVGYDSTKVTGVSDAPLSPTFIWNFWEWKLAS